MAKQRAWFQIHLLTAVVVMLTAGVVLYLNFHPNVTLSHREHFDEAFMQTEFTNFGWPYYCYLKSRYVGSYAVDSSKAVLDWESFGSRKHLLLNILIGLGLCLLVAVLFELMIRKRNRSRQFLG